MDKESKTGLPDNIRSAIANLSIDIDKVQVHVN